MKRNSEVVCDSDTIPANPVKLCRLGKCEVCNSTDAKYTCPKCEVKTCSLSCHQIHKKELNCDGIRDKTKFIPVNKMTEMDFFSDYTFLEECTRYVEARKRDGVKRFTRYNKSLPAYLFSLRNAANQRGTTLRFFLDNFTRRTVNTTRYDKQSKVISWRVEWIFTNAGNLKYVDGQCSEERTLCQLVDKYLNPESTEDVPVRKNLEFYQSKGIGKLEFLLKAEGIKRCKDRFYLLDSTKSLKANLSGKVIVEFPCIHICFDDTLSMFDIIGSDEDVEAEAKEYKKKLDETRKVMLEKYFKERNTEKSEEDEQKQLEKLLTEKKREERSKKRAELEKDPGNLLFSDERLWDILSSSSDGGNETEEEVT